MMPKNLLSAGAQEFPRARPARFAHSHQTISHKRGCSGRDAVRGAPLFFLPLETQSHGTETPFQTGADELVIGLLFLGACLLISELMLRQTHGTLLNLVRESLTIAGWVAMWRPMQIFLYDWWPLQRVGHIYEKLARIPVELHKPVGPQ